MKKFCAIALALIFAVTGCYMSGCASVRQRRPPRVKYPRLKSRPQPRPRPRVQYQKPKPRLLVSQCSANVVGCLRINELGAAQSQLSKLHRLQMNTFRTRLKSFAKALNQPVAIPIVAVKVMAVESVKWKSAEGSFPVGVKVEFYYKQSSERHPDIQAVRNAFELLRITGVKARNEWDRIRILLSRGRHNKIDPGAEITEQRLAGNLRFQGSNARVPQWLLDEIPLILPKPQKAVVSLVTTQKGLQYRELESHVESILPAFDVIGRRRGSPVVIKEHHEVFVAKTYKFLVESKDFCQALRAEVRILNADQSPRRAWSIQPNKEN